MKKKVIAVIVVIALIAGVVGLFIFSEKSFQDDVYKATEKSRQFKQEAEDLRKALGGEP